MVERLDDRIGAILKELDGRGATKNTLVIFASDNGGPQHSRNEPYSGRKGTTYEGGIRVPCILRWPEKLAAGSESKQVGITMDLTTSILNLAAEGTRSVPATHSLDGIDLVEHVRLKKPDLTRTLFWRKTRGEQTWWGVRDGDLKLVQRKEAAQRQEWLFDLASDPAEKNNLATSRGMDVERLKRSLAQWEQEVKSIR